MKIDDSIVTAYLEGKQSSDYSRHWIYSNVMSDTYAFSEPSPERTAEVEDCREGLEYAVFDLIHFSDNILNGANIETMVNGLLSHELVHVIINTRYPGGDFSYRETLDYISFHEGFAHLLSYKEDIHKYQPNDKQKEIFRKTKKKLFAASEIYKTGWRGYAKRITSFTWA